MEKQFDNFLTLENFYLAYQRLQTASRNPYKELYFEDIKIFGFFLEENISILLNEIEQNIFKPESSYKIFIPKKNNLFRPLSLLKFKDLLVYQAIINTIADVVYDEIAPYYNSIIFGNVYNTSKENKNDRIFLFKPWKQQWNKFEENTKKYYKEGYKFLSDFDIASFFDTIDHYILQQILENNFQVDSKLIALLMKLLEAFTSDSNHKTFRSKHGIPQGPIGSALLADLYLFHFVDLEMLKNRKILNIQYIRYVDDIRIFSKDKISAQKAIAHLDLLARDLGLIPQPTKITFNEINNLDKILKSQKNKFSAITKEYKKAKGSLKSKTHRRLKERFIECFNEKSEKEEYLDKTLIKFSLYKLNKDEDIKSIILNKWEFLYIHIEEILFYLREHFSEDHQVRNWLIEILRNQNLLFHHVVALIFKFFPDIEFMEDVYQRYFLGSDRHWLVRYFMFYWLYKNNKIELILLFQSDNYFLNREANNFKFRISQEPIYLGSLVQSLLKDKDSLVALHGLNLGFFQIMTTSINFDRSEFNEYIRYIFSKDMTDYIKHHLKNEFSILAPENFFNKKIWTDNEIYQELNISFQIFFEYRNIDSSKSLLNLNSFNNLLYDKICEILKICKPAPDYGVNLNSGCIKDYFPITNMYFTQINEKRNQKTEAHPYDKYGNLRIKISIPELGQLIRKQQKALEEICQFNFLSYL
ncbi:RNA-directed DNA polymerase [Anabaena sp. UHCC 0187]|nr:RNA-directed DNA polymerase [Anabaena sp. UHCC 0187]